MSDWPSDVEKLADSLNIDRFVVASHSSGGPYGIACAALLSNRVSGVIVLAGVTDITWPTAWTDYFEPEVAMMRMPDEQSVLERCEELFGADGSGLLGFSGPELSEPDTALFSDEKMANAMLASIAEALRQGVGGYAQDIFIQGRAWPFDPGAITTPVILAHGELDTIVAIAHSRQTAELIPGSSLRIIPGHGHISISSELPGLCAELIESLD
jgi:pimeloyl-ACP methyl ester carboxylesterase